MYGFDGFHDSRGNRFIAETLKGLILAAVLAGAVTPGMEIYRSLALKENFERFTVTTPGTQTYKSLADYKISIPRFEDVRDVDRVTHPEQYIGHRRSFFFRVLARDSIRERIQ